MQATGRHILPGPFRHPTIVVGSTLEASLVVNSMAGLHHSDKSVPTRFALFFQLAQPTGDEKMIGDAIARLIRIFEVTRIMFRNFP